jgi:hypothetical protein
MMSGFRVGQSNVTRGVENARGEGTAENLLELGVQATDAQLLKVDLLVLEELRRRRGPLVDYLLAGTQAPRQCLMGVWSGLATTRNAERHQLVRATVYRC